MEESGKEISMREYPLSRGKTIGRRQWLTVYLHVFVFRMDGRRFPFMFMSLEDDPDRGRSN